MCCPFAIPSTTQPISSRQNRPAAPAHRQAEFSLRRPRALGLTRDVENLIQNALHSTLRAIPQAMPKSNTPTPAAATSTPPAAPVGPVTTSSTRRHVKMPSFDPTD
ncbi:hypothetical protein Vafri_21449 [Volvox africanus]|uniref:Uncharacterized protein n=1 Tax=Volvox africanus TaxID=51714 RepID=A0A8J4BTC7_9CHLO|nr:hypothetical protein Vafri_21449 [Volvox africanus]